MNTRWEIWLDDARGNRLTLLDGAGAWEIVRTENEIGSFQLLLPGNFDTSLLVDDGMVEFWRAPEGGSLKWVSVGLITDIDDIDDADGRETILLSGPDGMDLLDRRIVAYAAGSAQAAQTDQADDMCKVIVRQNLGASATDSSRNLSSLGLSVAADVSLAPSITKKFAWRNVLQALRDIANASRQAGTHLYYDMVPTLVSQTQIGFEFQTFTGQRGIDHTAGSANPVYFGREWGNLQGARLARTRRGEANYAYVGGQGDESSRTIQQVSDTARIAASPWNRREIFVDARQESSADGLTTRGRTEIAARRPRYRFTGTLLDTEQTQLGRDWDFGDRMTCQHRRLEFDAEVRSIRHTVNEQGQELVDVKIEAEL